MKKTLAIALMLSFAALSAGAYASDNTEPNNVPFQAFTARPIKARPAPRFKPNWLKPRQLAW